MDVDDVHAVVLAGLATPRGQVGVAVKDADVGDLAGDDPAQLELADQLDVLARRRQVTRVAAVLVMVVRRLGVVDGAVVARRTVVPRRRCRRRQHCGDGCGDRNSVAGA
jgi:hypothetical protein